MQNRTLISIKTKQIVFEVEETPNCEFNPYSMHFQRQTGDWSGLMAGFSPLNAKDDIGIIDEVLECFINRDYNENEIQIVKNEIDKIRTPQLELF